MDTSIQKTDEKSIAFPTGKQLSEGTFLVNNAFEAANTANQFYKSTGRLPSDYIFVKTEYPAIMITDHVRENEIIMIPAEKLGTVMSKLHHAWEAFLYHTVAENTRKRNEEQANANGS